LQQHKSNTNKTKMTELKTVEERILSCLDGLEFLAEIEVVEDGWDSISSRIHNITDKHFNWYKFRIYDRLMEKEEHTPMLYQQLLYHLIPEFTQDEKIRSHLVKVLFGENDEYLIKSESLFNEDLHHEVYETCVREHMESFRAWFFEKEDLDGEDLERHLEFVAYAKEHNL
jgi:hypothetical protein